MNRKRLQQICEEIATDMRNDASAFDGRPFNGRTVAEYFGNQGAAIAALARIVGQMLAEGDDEHSESAPATNAVGQSVENPT